MVGEIAQAPQMMPFELNNRYHMDAWNNAAEPVSLPGSRWFSSKTHWCNTPYLPPAACTKIEYRTAGPEEAGWFGAERSPKRTKSKSRSPRRCSMTCRWSAWGPRPTTCCR